jgi:short-subunit dehydrogenase
MNLQGKTAVVTGASSGLGEALARALAAGGCTVVMAARRFDRLQAIAADITAGGGRAVPLACDVTIRSEAEELIARAIALNGSLDILINNAGRGHFGLVEETTDEIVRSILEVNVVALWHCTRPALAQMKRQGAGRIVTIASLAGKMGYVLNSAYVAAKHAAVGFTHALRQELSGTNIIASVACPSGIATGFAGETEGGKLEDLFALSGAAIDRSASRLGSARPDVEPVMAAADVARAILASLDSTEAEIYTHRGSREFVRLLAENPAAAERQMLPVAEGELEAYRKLKRGGIR